MSKKKERICKYRYCCIPDDNKKYLFQLGYLVISVFYLISDKSQLTFFSLIMFTIPIILDLYSVKIPVKLFSMINNVFLSINVAIFVFSFMGMMNIFVDDSNRFFVSENSLIMAGFGFEKTVLLFPLVINLFIPIMMYNASPSKKTRWLVDRSMERGKVGSL